jgi:MFS family permease
MASTLKHQQSARWAFAVVAYALFISNAGGNLLSPLYELYRRAWDFPAADITIIYAIYALVLIPGLPIFGALSKRLGSKTTLMIAGIFVLVGSALALVSVSVIWLGAVRVLQGIGIAMISGVGAKTLVQQVPPEEHDKASLAATMTLAGGGAFGVLMAGALAQFVPEPLKVPYVAHIVLLIPGLIALSRLNLSPPASVPQAETSALSRYPRDSGGRTVLAACVGGFTSFAVLGMFLSIAPTIVANSLGIHAPIVGAAVASFMLIASSVAQLVAKRASYRTQMYLGLILLPSGIVGFSVLMTSGSLVLVLGTVVLGGLGHGLMFLGGLEMIDRVSQESNRATLAAIYFAASYAGASIPVIALGFLAQTVGVRQAVGDYAGLVTLGCAATFVLFLWVVRGKRQTNVSLSSPIS